MARFYGQTPWGRASTGRLCGLMCVERNKIIFNLDKFVFSADTVEFAGFEISPQSTIHACYNRLPPPKDLTDVDPGLTGKPSVICIEHDSPHAPITLTLEARNTFHME